MKKLFFAAAAALAFALFSCKKDSASDMPVQSDNTPRVKTGVGSAGLYKYSYDAAGRHIETDYPNGDKTTIEYMNGKVILKKYTGNTLTISYTYELNSDGYATKQTRSTQPEFYELRIYNAAGQVEKLVDYFGPNNVLNSDFFYTNGNCDSIRYSTNGQWTSSVRKTYYTDKLNVLSNEAYGEPYFGKSDKNLLKTEQYIYSDGSTNTMVTYTYDFDAQGRVIKETDSGQDIHIYYYTY